MRIIFTLYFLVFYLFQAKIGLSSNLQPHNNDLEDPQENKICMICLDELNPLSSEENHENISTKNRLSLKILECQDGIHHSFHQKCFNKWVYEYHHFSCPICRSKITPNIYHLNCHGKIKEIRRRYYKTLFCLGSCLTGTAFLAAGFGIYIVVSTIISYGEAISS